MHNKMCEIDNLNIFLVEERKYLESAVELTEKLDGSNFSAHTTINDDYEVDVVFRSRTGVVSPANIKMFKDSMDFLYEKIFKLKDTEILFGENMHKHRIDYGNIDSPFYAFGIYNIETKAFDKNWAKRCKKLNIPTVPIIDTNRVISFDELKEMSVMPTLLGTNKTEREGVVIKNYCADTQWMCKVVNPRYFESHTAKPPRQPEEIHEPTKEYALRHATDNRIIKAILRLRDEQGMEISMSMMQPLIKATVADIFKECKSDMPENANAKQFNKIVADQCRTVLHKYLNGDYI